MLFTSCSNSQVDADLNQSISTSMHSTSNEKTMHKPSDLIKLVQRQVLDREGTGLVASTYLIPADWTVNDRLFWVYQDPTLPFRVQATMYNADNTMGIQIFPDVRAVYSTGPTGTSGYPPPRDIISGMKDLIRQERKGKNITYLNEKVLHNNSQNTQQGMNYSSSAIIDVAYEENGKQWEEQFYAKLEIYHVVTPSLYGNMESIIWQATGLMASKAVKGKLEECKRIAQTLISSAQLTKPFYNRLSQVVQLLSDQVYASIYQAGQISKIISQTNDQMIANIDASYRQANESYDRTNQNFSDYIRGVDRYDEGGKEVELPSGYNHAWVNDRGEYLLTNSTGFNPAVEFRENWKMLEKN